MPHQLLGYEQAVSVIESQTKPKDSFLNVPLGEALGYALAEPIIASAPNPRFDNSEVDGYAVGHLSDAEKGSRLQLGGSIAAGQRAGDPISP